VGTGNAPDGGWFNSGEAVSLFAEVQHLAAGSVLWLAMTVGDGQMDVWSIFIFIVFVASIPLATEMARERGRSRRVWLFVASIAGPLAAVMLLLLGDRRDRKANHV
jgi:hypothetical protein